MDTQHEELESIDTPNLDAVTGGVLPLIPIAGAAIGVGGIAATIWAAGHDKGVAESNCKK
jgi:hypothetical protein